MAVRNKPDGQTFTSHIIRCFESHVTAFHQESNAANRYGQFELASVSRLFPGQSTPKQPTNDILHRSTKIHLCVCSLFFDAVSRWDKKSVPEERSQQKPRGTLFSAKISLLIFR